MCLCGETDENAPSSTILGTGHMQFRYISLRTTKKNTIFWDPLEVKTIDLFRVVTEVSIDHEAFTEAMKGRKRLVIHGILK